MDECKHWMNPEWCSDCRAERDRAAGKTTVELVVVHRFTAQYGGRCAADSAHRIEPGDEIGVTDDGEYVCEECSGG